MLLPSCCSFKQTGCQKNLTNTSRSPRCCSWGWCPIMPQVVGVFLLSFRWKSPVDEGLGQLRKTSRKRSCLWAAGGDERRSEGPHVHEPPVSVITGPRGKATKQWLLCVRIVSDKAARSPFSPCLLSLLMPPCCYSFFPPTLFSLSLRSEALP